MIRGAGDKAFASGTDINQFRAFKSPQDSLDYEARIDRVDRVVAEEDYAFGRFLDLSARQGFGFIDLQDHLLVARPADEAEGAREAQRVRREDRLPGQVEGLQLGAD